MRRSDNDDEYFITDDQPACEVDATITLLQEGLDEGPGSAPVRVRGWGLRWAPRQPHVVVCN